MSLKILMKLSLCELPDYYHGEHFTGLVDIITEICLWYFQMPSKRNKCDILPKFLLNLDEIVGMKCFQTFNCLKLLEGNIFQQIIPPYFCPKCT